MGVEVHLVCEGASDVPFLERLVKHAGAEPAGRYMQNGSANLDKAIARYCQAASSWQDDLWLVVRDSDGDCVVELP